VPTDAIALLKDDHRAVEELFKKFEKVGERALKTRQALVDKMLQELVTHTYIEEQVFYPFIRTLSKKLNDDTLEALEEHHAAKATLAELQLMDSSQERFTPKVTVLIESVRHHVKEEERELFPEVRRASSRRDLVDLVPALQAAKSSAPSRALPNAPDTPRGETSAPPSLGGVLDHLTGVR
jgi:iron-sulfur cluster repair protein YtfE (RIC family)